MKRHHTTVTAFGGSLLLAGMLALAACGSGTSSASSGAKPSSTPSSANSSLPSAAQVLAHVRSATLQSANVTTSEKIDTAKGVVTASSTGAVQFTPSFAEQLSTTATASGQTVHPDEIVYGQNIYVKRQSDSTWTQIPLSQLAAISNGQISPAAVPSFSLAHLTNISNATNEGTKTIDGMQTYDIRGQASQATTAAAASGSSSAQSASYIENLYVNTTTYQPVEVTFNAQTSAGTITSTTIFRNWNSGTVSIAPPSNSVPASSANG